MSSQEREYMARDEPEVPIVATDGIKAKTQADAERILQFACPTKAADGKWYRTTIAVSNVPVAELYNILSNANFISQRLREIASGVGGEAGDAILVEAAKIDGLREMIKREDRPKAIAFHGSNVHEAKPG